MTTSARDWFIDGLRGLGAEVDDENGGISVLMDKDLASALSLEEFCRISFNPLTGRGKTVFADAELLDKLEAYTADRGQCAGALVPPDASVSWPSAAKAAQFIDLISGKSVFRDVQVASQTYTVCFCRSSAVSDEKREILVGAAVNPATQTVSEQLGAAVESLLEENVLTAHASTTEKPAPQTLELLSALLAHRTTVRLDDFLVSLRKRLERDCRRIHGYYSDLLAGAVTPSPRKKTDPQELSERADAIRREFSRKIDDLRIKYLVKTSIEPIGILTLELPCALARFTVYMGNTSREITIPWNPVTGSHDLLLCEKCRRPAQSIRICREFHWLCSRCWKRCERCRKEYCTTCKPKGCSCSQRT